MRIIRKIKGILFFSIAQYFSFWARIILKRWRPTVIVVTGSSGKTTLLHLLEAQLREKAIYSHHANSAFGIPFHLLGLERESFKIYEWFSFAFLAPFKAFRPLPQQKIYVAECDAERPGEGKFLAELLRPDILVWLSLEEAHGVYYDRLVPKTVDENLRLSKVRDAIAHEFGNFLDYTKKLAVLNEDNPYIKTESIRAKSEIAFVSEKMVSTFEVLPNGVRISAGRGFYSLPKLIPRQAALSVLAIEKVVKSLGFSFDNNFNNFVLPPGRSSVFAGKKNITIIDSTYNATFDGVRSMLDLMTNYHSSSPKWLVLGDMIEQGKSEETEHRALASIIESMSPDRIVFVGPRLQKNTYPLILEKFSKEKIFSCLMPRDVLDYLEKELKGNEVVLFKGARYLEGVVEKLLADPKDIEKLCRRELIWQKRRKDWGI